MKPGYKTTEFWLASLSSAVTWLVQAGVLGADVPKDAVMAVAANAVIVVGYALSRAKAKSAPVVPQ